MKSLIAVLIAVPTIAFGHTCYEAKVPAYMDIPQQFCLESISESTTVNEIAVYSHDGFPSVLKITETSRHNEDRLRFTAEAILVDVWNSGCGDGFKATLKVKSEIAYGEISAKNLNITVETEQTNDTCHSHPQLDVIQYELVK